MKRRATIALVLLVALLVASPPAIAETSSTTPEQRRRDIDRELERLEGQVDEAAAAEAELLAELEVTRSAKAALDARVAELDTEVAGAATELARAESSLAAAEERLASSRRRLDDVRRRLQVAQEELEAQAVAAYIDPRRGREQVDVVLRVRNVRELHEAQTLLQSVIVSRNDVLERHRALEEDVAHLTDVLQASRDEAQGSRDAVEAHKAALEATLADQRRAQAEAEAEARREEDLLAQVRAQRGAYEQRIAGLRQESDTITALLRSRQAGQRVTISGKGVLGSPLASPVVTSRFGNRTHPIFLTERLHAGVDFGAGTGTPILAAGDGTVVFAGWKGGYGNAVVIDHGGSLATLYAHQSQLGVSAGDQVRRGQVIGSVGSTGFSTGPHLHFEVRTGGVPVDPLNYL